MRRGRIGLGVVGLVAWWAWSVAPLAWADSFPPRQLVTAGADADSTTTQSDSGLEFLSQKMTLLRGCADNEILKWDETDDDWNCETDGGAAGGGFDHTFRVETAKLPTSNPCVIDSGNNRRRLLCDATTAESADWYTVLSPYNAGALTANVYYSMASATSGTVEFEMSLMCVTDADAADVDTDSFDTVNTGTATVPGTAGYLDVIAVTMTNADSCAENDLLVLRLARDADDATNDTASGDAEIRAVQLTE